MNRQNNIYASDIKGYCPLDVCWQFIRDLSEQIEEKHKKGLFCETISLNDVQIQEKTFVLEEGIFGLNGNEADDVWMLAAAVFELMLGTPIFNGMGKKIQTEHTPLPSLPGNEMACLNKLLQKCMYKDESKRPPFSDILSTVSGEVKRCSELSRKPRLYATNHQNLSVEEYDKKWPEQMMIFKSFVIFLFCFLSSAIPALSQSLLNPEEEKQTLKLVEAVLSLRTNTKENWDAAQYELSTMSRLFTAMDELKDVNNDCALIGQQVKSFGLNRMIKELKKSKDVVQNTGKGLLDGSDSRFNYSIYEKGIKKGCTATYNKLTGRSGKQVFIIIPYSANQSYTAELSLSNGRIYSPTQKDKNGITYYVIETNDGPQSEETLMLKVKNEDYQNNHSFVIINHNYRNK